MEYPSTWNRERSLASLGNPDPERALPPIHMQILAGNGRVTGGEILYKGEDILKYNKQQMRHFRGAKCSIISRIP